MQNKIFIVLGSLLALALLTSLSGNIYQYYQSTKKQEELKLLQDNYTATQAKLQKTTSDLASTKTDLSTAKSDLSTATAKISSLNTQVEQIQDDYDDLKDQQSETQEKLDDALDTLNDAFCYITIPISDVMYVSTDQSLLDTITSAAERQYDMSSTNSSYDVIWNNSKNAIFTIKMSDKTTTKVTVAWSWDYPNHVHSIYNMSAGCYFYLDPAY